jgi:asparagine synthase (glutamine-hydrolysing)
MELYNTDIVNAMFATVSRCLNKKNSKTVGIAFSGGVDSTILARICRNLGQEVVLLTVGFNDSYDIRFSRKISSIMNMSHEILEICCDEFYAVSEYIRKIIHCTNISHIENCIAFYFVSKLALDHNISDIISANGCDEIFCGYNSFRLLYEFGTETIVKTINDRLKLEYELVNEVKYTCNNLGVDVWQPFLSTTDFLRKHILRKIALSLEVPAEVVISRKKAFQYGSSIHKNYKKLI